MAPSNNAYLSFDGSTFPNGKVEQSFTALCGDDPPIVTDGYAIWSSIARPLLRGVTVPQGFMPATMKVSVRFGVWSGDLGTSGWDIGAEAGHYVEQSIGVLEWMAGANQASGGSPCIAVTSHFAAGKHKQNYLIPPNYWGLSWVINGGLQWGQMYRNPDPARGGTRPGTQRVYAECDFVLLNYIGLGANPPPHTKVEHGGYFTTTKTLNTALKIAASFSSRSTQSMIQSLANAIRDHHNNNPIRGTHIHLKAHGNHWHMPEHLKVWVPGHATS